MPRLAAFPKAFMDELCVNGQMTIEDWVGLASSLDIDGLEFYCGFLGTGRRVSVDRLAGNGGRPRARDSDALLLARLYASRSGLSPPAGRPGKADDRHDGRLGRAILPRPLRAAAARGEPSRRHPLRRRVHRGLPAACRRGRRDADSGEPLQGQLTGSFPNSPSRWTSSASWWIGFIRQISA